MIQLGLQGPKAGRTQCACGLLQHSSLERHWGYGLFDATGVTIPWGHWCVGAKFWMGLTGSLCQLQDAVVPMDQDVPGSRAFWWKGHDCDYFLLKQYNSESGGLRFLDHTESRSWIQGYFQAHALCDVVGWDFFGAVRNSSGCLGSVSHDIRACDHEWAGSS